MYDILYVSNKVHIDNTAMAGINGLLLYNSREI